MTEPSVAIKSLFSFGDESVPFLALAIHNGADLPVALAENCGIATPDRLREEDPYTGNITTRCCNNVTVYSSRFMVDLNRSREKAVYQKPEDCWGLNPRLKPIDSKYLEQLYKAYEDWYLLLDYHLSRMLARHDMIYVLDLHSYNHRRGGRDAEADPQILNPDLIIGRSNLPESYYPVVSELTRRLNGALWCGYPLDCREDVKFPGGNLSRYLHARYPGRVLSLSIEFKKIFMDEHSGDLDRAKFGHLIALFWDRISDWAENVLQVADPVKVYE